MGEHVRSAQRRYQVNTNYRATPSLQRSLLTRHLSRPLGGIISDLLYKHVSTNLWLKKGWILFVGIISGAFLIAIGLLNPQDETTMFGLIAGMAFFLEAGNGYDFLPTPSLPSSLTATRQSQFRSRPTRPPACQRCPQRHCGRHGQFRRCHFRHLVQIPRHGLFREFLDHGVYDYRFQPVDGLGAAASQGSDRREVRRVNDPGQLLVALMLCCGKSFLPR